jgi:hypothetical protein
MWRSSDERAAEASVELKRAPLASSWASLRTGGGAGAPELLRVVRMLALIASSFVVLGVAFPVPNSIGF